MEFLKRHYEKIILSLVLIGLAVVAVKLPMAISQAKDELENPTGPTPKAKPATPFDLAPLENALVSLTNPPHAVLSGENNLFDPVIWKMKADGEFIKITKEGPAALTITKITPLFTVIAYDGPSSGASGVYNMLVQRNSEKKPKEYARINAKPPSGLYIVREAKGPPDNPTDLVLELPETKETVSISKNKPYQRIDGYSADLKYPAADPMTKKRVGEIIKLDGEAYKIIEITENAVRVESSTAKQTKIDWNSASALLSPNNTDNTKP
jgi:hypothetical protein